MQLPGIRFQGIRVLSWGFWALHTTHRVRCQKKKIPQKNDHSLTSHSSQIHLLAADSCTSFSFKTYYKKKTLAHIPSSITILQFLSSGSSFCWQIFFSGSHVNYVFLNKNYYFWTHFWELQHTPDFQCTASWISLPLTPLLRWLTFQLPEFLCLKYCYFRI